MCTYLIELFCHLANNVRMLHVMVHVRCDAATTARTMNEKLDQLQQRSIPVLLVCLNPLIYDRLAIRYKSDRFSKHSMVKSKTDIACYHYRSRQNALYIVGLEKLQHSISFDRQ